MHGPRILVIGAGPTGTAAAWQLHVSGCDDWLLVDCDRREVDGRQSVVDHAGFLWDPAARPFLCDDPGFEAIVEQTLGSARTERILGCDDVHALETLHGCGAEVGCAFAYPLDGGCGGFWRTLRRRLPRDRVVSNTRTVRVDTALRQARFADGSVVRYDALISTLPLDRLDPLLDGGGLRSSAARLRYHAAHFVGVAVNGALPADLEGRHFTRLPGDDGILDPVSILSNLSPASVPHPSRQWSILVEVVALPGRRFETSNVLYDTVDRLHDTEFLPAGASVANVWHDRIDHGLPVVEDTCDHEVAVAELRERGIISCGPFGAWNPALVDPDLLFAGGVEAADEAMDSGQPSTTAPWLLATADGASRQVFRR